MTELDALIAEAELGEEAKGFLEGNLGRFLVGCAEQEVNLAHLALESADPSDAKTIADLQNKVWRARKFEEWLKELVSKGENAIAAYKQQKQED